MKLRGGKKVVDSKDVEMSRGRVDRDAHFEERKAKIGREASKELLTCEVKGQKNYLLAIRGVQRGEKGTSTSAGLLMPD